MKQYTEPELTVTAFEAEDVITESIIIDPTLPTVSE